MGKIQIAIEKIKNLDKKRKYLFYVSVALLFGSILALFIMPDPFKTITEITYPDHCVEKYVNDNLTTPICVRGRELKEEEETKVFGNQIVKNINWSGNFTFKIQ